MSVSMPSQKRRSEVQINCAKCGGENWLENQSKCLQCRQGVTIPLSLE